MAKKSFILHLDSLSVLDKMTDEQCWQLLKKMKSYHNGNNYKADPIIDLVFESFKNQFDRDKKKYETICERNKQNGLKWGRPKNPKNPDGYFGNPKEPKKPDNDSDNDSDNKKENNNNNKKEKNNKNKKENNKILDFVYLSNSELNKLKKEIGENETKKRIEKLNIYIWSTWKKYKSHYFTILNWSKKENNNLPAKKEFKTLT